jgi:hypothetical protein
MLNKNRTSPFSYLARDLHVLSRSAELYSLNWWRYSWQADFCTASLFGALRRKDNSPTLAKNQSSTLSSAPRTASHTLPLGPVSFPQLSASILAVGLSAAHHSRDFAAEIYYAYAQLKTVITISYFAHDSLM